ncbi:hypothetical protein [Aestuariivirga sp.]|uniref:hypothetical protein n=1 Tax=Aestuariivirga sp. TaxID=2650926 RepID=UPI0039E6F471
MSSVIYITGRGADPGAGRFLGDPTFKPIASLGACMPNVRRMVQKGDWIFVISGKTVSLPQYIIGGIKVAEKITALEAFERYPSNRLRLDDDGRVIGNIPVDANGVKHPLDGHRENGFERRALNFIVGGQSIHFDKPREIERSREETLRVLAELKNKQGNRPIDIIGRFSKVEDEKLSSILNWMKKVKEDTHG